MRNYICALDLSLNRPGYALVEYCPEDRSCKLQKIANVDNKTVRGKPEQMKHAEILGMLHGIVEKLPPADITFVRDESFYRHPDTSERIWKVYGVVEYDIWQRWGKRVEKVGQSEVKRILTGSGKASKADTAQALSSYVGHVQYSCDDESDAVGVAVAFLVRQGCIERRPGKYDNEKRRDT